jgi:[acyl-carrier-protein] S-malonyltransferase
VLTILKNDVPAFEYAAGHSLGEYGALAVAGALTYEDAVKAVIKRATLMEEACVKNPSTMAAIIGLSDEQVEDVCRKASEAGVVVPANYNSPNQVVISGVINAVEKAMVLAKEAGAKRAIKLEVGGAFHSPLMQSATDGLASHLNALTFAGARKPVVANVTAQPVTQAEEIRRLLVQQITAPVRWAQTMRFLGEQGVTGVIEIGPGKVLTGMARREMKLGSCVNLDTFDDIKSFAPVSASQGEFT